MKKILTILSIAFFITANSANAFDLGGLVSQAEKISPEAAAISKDAQCATTASELITEGGSKAMEMFTQASAANSVAPTVAKEDQGLLTKVMKYVTDGCAKDHLTKALSLVQ